MAQTLDRLRHLDDDSIRSLTNRDMLRVLRETDDVSFMRHLAAVRFAHEASMKNDLFDAPFIEWKAMNKNFEPWLAVLLAKVAKRELNGALENGHLIMVAVPRSATPYVRPILDEHIISGVQTPWVLKEDQAPLYGVNLTRAVRAPIPSYVHRRALHTDLRVSEDIFFLHPELHRDNTVLLLDDALAEAVTANETARFLKYELGAARVFFATPMAKLMQGGIENIQQSGSIDAVSILVHVTGVHGPGKPIDFYT